MVHDVHRLASGLDSTYAASNFGYDHAGNPVEHYPQGADKRDVLRHGFDTAQQCPEWQDIIIPVAVLGAHPFIDGNSRAVRVLHASLLGRSSMEIANMGLANTRHEGPEAPSKVHDLINVHAGGLQPLYTKRVFELAGLSEELARAGSHVPPGTRGVTTYLNSLFYRATVADSAEGRVAPFHVDYPTLRFAEARLGWPDSTSGMGTCDRLAGNPGDLDSFMDAVWEYRKLYAIAKIDTVGHPVFSQHPVTLPGSDNPVPAREAFMRLTRNLRSSHSDS